jgi:hypothetical protein
MPYVASIGTDVPCIWGLSPEVAGFFTGIDAIGYEGLGSWGPQASRCGGGDYRQGERVGAQISLMHTVFRPAAGPALKSAKTIVGGTTYGAW